MERSSPLPGSQTSSRPGFIWVRNYPSRPPRTLRIRLSGSLEAINEDLQRKFGFSGVLCTNAYHPVGHSELSSGAHFVYVDNAPVQIFVKMNDDTTRAIKVPLTGTKADIVANMAAAGHACADSIVFAGRYLYDDRSLLSYGVQEECTVRSVTGLRGGKPVILIYGGQGKASVSLKLCPRWEFSVLYPTPNAGTATARRAVWNVTLGQCGDASTLLVDLNHYSYLFWEAVTCPEAGPLFTFEPTRCFSRANVATRLGQELLRRGLNIRERDDCLTYWLEKLTAHPFVCVQFVDPAEYAAAAKLEMTPAPDVMIRVFFLFVGCTKEVVIDDAAAAEAVVPGDEGTWPQSRPEAPDRVTVVEWGAMEMHLMRATVPPFKRV